MQDSKREPSTYSEKETAPDDIQIVNIEPHVTRRDLGLLNIIAIGFNVPNSWLTIASSFSIAIAAGGPVSLIFGTCVSGVFYACAGITLAELASMYPTAGGQYHFTSILAPERWNRSFAYTCGIISCLSWTINAAGCTLLATQLLVALPQFFNGYEPTKWQMFLISQALNVFAFAYNVFLIRRTTWIHQTAFLLTLTTFIVCTILSLARSEKASSAWVWTNFEVNTGLPPGVSFLTGLTTPCYMYGGLDAALHLAEETLDAARAVPKALISAVSIGFITGFIFSVAMAYCIVDIQDLLHEPIPIYKLWRIAMKSNVAGSSFIVILTILVVFILIAIMQTSSRLLWSFACDHGLFLSNHLSKLSTRFDDNPVNALVFNSVLILLCGCLYLGSDTAFNALVNTFLLMQMISFAMPAALLIYRKRSSQFLSRSRPFRVPGFIGWACNIGTIVAAIIETIFFCFPTTLPVSGESMNYASAVLAVVALIALANWFCYTRKVYQGPRI